MKLKDKKIAYFQGLIALCIGVIITCGFSAYAQKTEKSIADNLIRLHVIANSDSDADQALKYAVRDAIVSEVGTLFADNSHIGETKSELIGAMDSIKHIAKRVIEDNGYNYSVNLVMGKSDFPTKTYGNVTLPAGTYEALKVVIGDGAGQNWWCVLFPPLCFVDGATAEMPAESSEILKSSLTDEEYEMITESGDFPVKVKFKAYEMWQSSKLKLKNMVAKK